MSERLQCTIRFLAFVDFYPPRRHRRNESRHASPKRRWFARPLTVTLNAANSNAVTPTVTINRAVMALEMTSAIPISERASAQTYQPPFSLDGHGKPNRAGQWWGCMSLLLPLALTRHPREHANE